MEEARAVLFQYIIVVTRDIFEERMIPYYYELAAGLMSQRTKVSLFFTQEGVHAAQRDKYTAELRYFLKANIELWIDEQSARRRGLGTKQLSSLMRPILLNREELAPKTFIFVDPPESDNLSAQRALNLALRRGFDVSFFSYEDALNLIISRPEFAAPVVTPASDDWVSLLLDNTKRAPLTLTWVNCSVQTSKRDLAAIAGIAPLLKNF